MRGKSQKISDWRDKWLRLDDSSLLMDCHQERYRASGPGGQRRNKVETAIRLRHEPTGIIGQAEESRSLEENRIRALRRLRHRLALELRSNITQRLPLEFLAQKGPKGSLKVSRHNSSYPIVIATVLDAVNAAKGYKEAATMLGLTTSQLMKFLKGDPQIWQAICEHNYKD